MAVMSPDEVADELSQLAPEEAFHTLGNETRMEILRVLGEAERPLVFSEIFEEVNYDQASNFNYHLDKLIGYFVQKTDEGYALTTAGERVVEAVLSGVVTDSPILEPVILDQECYYCGAPLVMACEGHLFILCTSCTAIRAVPVWDHLEQVDLDDNPEKMGFLRAFELLPAGIQDRTAFELLRVANAWANWEVIASRVGICPRCSATIDGSIQVCDTHERDDGTCDECGQKYAVFHIRDCTNCIYSRLTQFGWLLLAETEVLNFVTSHGINPIVPASPMSMRAVLDEYVEEVVSTDPFRGRFTFTIDDESLTLTVDEDLTVVDVTSHGPDAPN